LTGTAYLYNIYFGTFTGSFPSLMDNFVTQLGGSNWYNIMQTYYHMIGGQITYASNSLKFVKSIYITPASTTTSITQYDVETYIQNALTNGQLKYDANGIYSFFFPGSYSLTAYDGSAWQVNWCGFHTSMWTANNEQLNYQVIGDTTSASQPTRCRVAFTTSPNGNMGFDGAASIVAHEIVETVSDWNGAWLDTAGADTYGWENGDLCAWTFGTYISGTTNANTVVGGQKYLLQQNWHVTAGGCRQQY